MSTNIFAVLKEAPSQKTGKTMLSGTEATHHHQSLDDIVDTKSVTSYAVTVTDIHGKGVNLPPPPSNADGERDFECPYCFIICPARYGRGRPWRTHLLQDLQPYICTYPDCEASEQLFRSRREWNEHEASHRKAWRCLEHPSAVYKSRLGLEEHLRQQHLDSFPENQLDTIAKAGETSTVETRNRCPICFLSVDADGMGDFANHVANHLERFAAFALPNSSEENEDGASSVASRGRTGSTASQDVSGMSLPSDVSDEQERAPPIHIKQREAKEEPFVYNPNSRELTKIQSLLSAESLMSVPDASQDRMDALLADQAGENDNEDEDEDEEDDQVSTPADIEEHLVRIEEFRNYLLSLSGARTVRFFRRYGSWRGHAVFNNGMQAAQAVELFDHALYPEVKIHQSAGSNRNKLKFSTTHEARQPPTRQSTTNAEGLAARSPSPPSMVYDDEESSQRKGPILSVSDIPTLRDMYRSRKLLQRDQSFAPNDSYNRIISFCYHDLTRLKVDAIVNSANNSMRCSKNAYTLNYSVHKAGGPRLSEEAAGKGRLKSGQAALTAGYNLPCDHVIHASRPQYSDNKGMGQFNILTECYRSSLRIALASGLRTVAFPCLGAGGCGFPPRVAARVALQEVREFLDSNPENAFERVIFVVQSALDEKAYVDLFPVFFPPTHGDLEVARSSDVDANRASLGAQVLETRLQVQKVAEALSAELSLFTADSPKEVVAQLRGIDSALASIRGSLVGSSIRGSPLGLEPLRGNLEDLSLLCSVMQNICGSLTEITESAKNLPFSGDRTHKSIWEDYNNHKKMVHGSNLEDFLSDCQYLAQVLDHNLKPDTVELLEEPHLAPTRERLKKFLAKQRSRDGEGVREQLDEVLYAREYQRETIARSTQDVVRLHRVPSVAQLYASNQLEEKSTMVEPSAVFNQTVCLVREDITKVEATVIVNSTDVSFTGMGTLDRRVFNKGGFELREACTKFGVCKEGDVKTTPGFNLPAKHVLHVVPPEQYRKNSKDVLRQIYREILYTAQSLKATSIAIPAIGTGMLNYPRRDCASLAMEEVNRFLETAEPTNLLEKIIFVVYSSNDEFVYKSLLPVYFPPIDRKLERALPASHPLSTTARPPPETIPAPKRTLFNSIGDAVRNLGSSRSGKRPVTHTWRAINTYEEHALIGFESHAQNCENCKLMEQLYKDGEDLCEHGYPLAQTLLWYMNLGPDQLVYTRPVQIRQSIRLEVPEDMFPLSLTMLRLVERSLRQEGRNHPFVSPNRAYSTVVQGRSEQDNDAAGPTIYSAEKALARVELWSTSKQTWTPLSTNECNIFIRQGRLDVYEVNASASSQEPLLAFILDPAANITKHVSQSSLTIRGAVAAQFDDNREIMLLSQSNDDCNVLLTMLHRANPDIPMKRKAVGAATGTVTDATAAESAGETEDSSYVAADKIESDSEQERNFQLHAQFNTNREKRFGPEGRLSPLQVKMQRLSEAASKFGSESPEQQSATIEQLRGDSVLPDQLHAPAQSQIDDGSIFRETLTALEHQILHHLEEDLKTRLGSYIGQSTNGIASALDRPLSEVANAIARLALLDYVHNTISENTWVVSRMPENLPALPDSQSKVTSRQEIPYSAWTVPHVTDEIDLLFQMDQLEQKILSYFTAFNSTTPLEKGCKAENIARDLKVNIEEVELALDQLAEQGKIHLAPDRETWNTPLPRQYNPPASSSHAEAFSSSEPARVRDATDFKDTPPSPVLPATDAVSQLPPIDIVDARDLELDESAGHPAEPGARWTRIDKAYVDPQVLRDSEEDFHEEEYSSIVHRVLRRGELKQWVQKTLDLRLKKPDIARERRGVSGHAWLDKGKEKEKDGRDERDLHQANLDRVLAGDMREDELRHFAGEDEDGRKR